MNEIKNIENRLVVQANSLIEASYKLKPSQQKFLRIMASMITKNDEDFKMYEFKISELIELFEVKDQSKYKEIPKQTRELMGNILTFKTDKKIIQVPFLNYCEYELGEGILKVQFHPYLKPFYLYLSKENPYTKYELKNILPLKSVYSIRIYELLKQFEKIGTRTIEISQLRNIFQIKPTEYTRYNDFKRFVLLQAQKEVPLKTDISFEFDEIKEKRKVTAIKFHIHSKNKNEKKTVAIDEPIPGQIDMEEVLNSDSAAADEEPVDNMMTEKELIELKAIFTEHELSNQAICAIYEDSKKDMELVRECYLQCLENKGTIGNVVGYMRKLVKDFEPSIQHKPVKKNKFLNFPQTKYNFDEIEQLEMKRQVEKLRKEGIIPNEVKNDDIRNQ